MTTTTHPTLTISRGDIWRVRFDPSEGDEIQKLRPAVVMNIKAGWGLRLHIVVPITGWQNKFEKLFWMTKLSPSDTNGLTTESSADAFQVKSLSEKRFETRVGSLSLAEVDEIAEKIALCVGYSPPDD